MYIKNVSNKPLGFGKTTILPNERAELPKGYGATHPTVIFMFKQKLIKAADKPEPANTTAPVNNEIATKIKALSRLGLEKLTAIAIELGIECGDIDDKDMLRQKIKDAYLSTDEDDFKDAE